MLSHFVPPDDAAVTDPMWLDAAQRYFRGTVIVGKDLLEIEPSGFTEPQRRTCARHCAESTSQMPRSSGASSIELIRSTLRFHSFVSHHGFGLCGSQVCDELFARSDVSCAADKDN